MLKSLLLLSIASLGACAIAGAGTIDFTVSGQFSSSDVANPPIVSPNGLFNISFSLSSTPTPVSGSVTSLSFDVLPGGTYTLNGVPAGVSPSEITFYTLANGGAFAVTFGSGLNAEEFQFQGAQDFTGTTAAPVFSSGTFAITGLVYSDASNFDSTATFSNLSVTPSPAASPEPSTYLLLPAGALTLVGLSLRKRDSRGKTSLN
jgi:hypothetical protein